MYRHVRVKPTYKVVVVPAEFRSCCAGDLSIRLTRVVPGNGFSDGGADQLADLLFLLLENSHNTADIASQAAQTNLFA